MADADKKIRESIDERVYPGAPSQGADGGAETSDGAPGASRSQILARAVFAVSLVLVIGSGAYFALRPSPAPEVQQAGSAVVAADVDDADDARADDEMGSSDAGKPDRRSLRLMWMMRMMRVRTTKWGLPTPTPTGATGQKPRLRRVAAPARRLARPGVPLRLPRALRGSPLHIPAHRVLPALPMVRPPANRGLPAGQSAAHSGSSGSSGSSDGQAAGKPGAPSGSGSGSSGQATISVNVTVDSSSAGGSVSANTTVALAPSSTAYDALCATGLSVNSRKSAFGVYVAGIGGLSEFDHGGGSGWKYKVNGTFPNHSASVHELHDGDSVVWVYVTG